METILFINLISCISISIRGCPEILAIPEELYFYLNYWKSRVLWRILEENSSFWIFSEFNSSFIVFQDQSHFTSWEPPLNLFNDHNIHSPIQQITKESILIEQKTFNLQSPTMYHKKIQQVFDLQNFLKKKNKNTLIYAKFISNVVYNFLLILIIIHKYFQEFYLSQLLIHLLVCPWMKDEKSFFGLTASESWKPRTLYVESF